MFDHAVYCISTAGIDDGSRIELVFTPLNFDSAFTLPFLHLQRVVCILSSFFPARDIDSTCS